MASGSAINDAAPDVAIDVEAERARTFDAAMTQLERGWLFQHQLTGDDGSDEARRIIDHAALPADVKAQLRQQLHLG